MKTILTCLAGSHAHGINVETSDYDYLSIAVAPLEALLGIQPYKETTQSREAPQGVRAAPGDVEHTTYELRHFVKLAAQGNPNILVPLFASSEHVSYSSPVGVSLREDLTPHLVSREALVRHLGYLDAQMGRIKGDGPHQARKPNRPELVEKYGYDTKYAGHALRLGLQGVQLAQYGKLILPLTWAQAVIVKAVRTGKYSEDEVFSHITYYRNLLKDFVNGEKTSPLPDRPNWPAIHEWLIWAHQQTALSETH